jgi:hypothetical protein
MNGIPVTPHQQPLTVDLVVEEYENIEAGKCYYATRRSVDPSGNLLFTQDYLLSIMEKSPVMIGVDMRMTRYASSGVEWAATTGGEDIQVFGREECANNLLTFFRPPMGIIDSVPLVGDATSDSSSDSESEAHEPLIVSSAEAAAAASNLSQNSVA